MRRPASLLTPFRLGLGALALVAGLAGCATLDEQQRRWIFQPSSVAWSGGLSAAQGMQDVWIALPGGEELPADEGGLHPEAAMAPTGGDAARGFLHGLWLPQPDRPGAPVLLYLHGARWDVRGSAPRMRRLHELGFAVLGIDYRGFGRSSALLPSEESALEDARAAWRWLGMRHPDARRYVFGHSLGSAIAVHVASEAEDVSGLIVEGSFPSIPDVFSTFKWGWLPVGPLITQRFEAAQRIGKVRAPVLVVHGSEDRLIPPALGKALFERASAPKRFVLVEGGSHHNTNALGMGQYREAVRELFGI